MLGRIVEHGKPNRRGAAEGGAGRTRHRRDLGAINQLAYPGATIKRVVARAVQEARRDALAEARQLVSKVFDDAKTEKPDYYCALLDLGSALDRLREGVE